MKKVLLFAFLIALIPLPSHAEDFERYGIAFSTIKRARNARYERVELRRRVRLRQTTPATIDGPSLRDQLNKRVTARRYRRTGYQRPSTYIPPSQRVTPYKRKKSTRQTQTIKKAPVKKGAQAQVAKQRRTTRRVSRAASNNEGLEVLSLVNAERQKAGLGALSLNTKLSQAAKAHAKDMNTRGYFRHQSPEGEDMEDRIRKTGYILDSFEKCDCRKWSYAVGENIALGQPTPKAVVDAWMKSEGHRRNILSVQYNEMGFARSGKYWVQTFGRMTME